MTEWVVRGVPGALAMDAWWLGDTTPLPKADRSVARLAPARGVLALLALTGIGDFLFFQQAVGLSLAIVRHGEVVLARDLYPQSLPGDEPEPLRVERVDLGGMPVPQAAAALGITANNAGVRLHRARAALRRQLERCCGACSDHHCRDCTCHRR